MGRNMGRDMGRDMGMGGNQGYMPPNAGNNPTKNRKADVRVALEKQHDSRAAHSDLGAKYEPSPPVREKVRWCEARGEMQLINKQGGWLSSLS